MFKKMILTTTLTFLAISASAQNCEKMKVQFVPHPETGAACQALGYTSEGSIEACSSTKAQLTNSRGAELDLSVSGDSWQSQTSDFDMEGNQVTITTVNMNLLRMSYSAYEVITDTRGHMRSQITCVGNLKAN